MKNRVVGRYGGPSSKKKNYRGGKSRFTGMRELWSVNMLLSASCTCLLQERLVVHDHLCFSSSIETMIKDERFESVEGECVI